MRKMKKFLASLLAFSMLVGSVPASAMPVQAEEAKPVDAAIIFSDLHTSSSNYKESTVKGIFNALKNTGLPFSSVTSAGDAFSVNEDSGKYTGKTSTITGYIQSVLGNIPVNYVWSDHDRYAVQADDKTLLSNDSGLIYGAGADGQYGTNDDDNYYIYSLSMADLSTNNRYNADFHTDAEVTAAIADFSESVSNLKKDRPLFIASHQPLLARRGDNGHAAKWCNAINSIAEKMDVAFFFGHNHKYDVTSDYYYEKGSDMPVAQSNNDKTGANTKINFTHMCAGYMAPSSTGSTSSTTRQGTAVAITIYDNSINYTTYNSAGVYTGNYALNETVTRAFASTGETPEGGDTPGTGETPSNPDSEESSNEVGKEITVGGDSYEEKIVYVKVDNLENNQKYLITNKDLNDVTYQGNTQSGVALVRNNTSFSYENIEVLSGTIEGIDGTKYSNGYIENDNANAVWTVTQESNGWRLNNGGYNVRYRYSTLSLNTSTNYATWSYSNNRLSNSGQYLYHSYYDHAWKTSSNPSGDSTRNIFFYKEVTAKIPTSTKVTYTMQASNVEHVLDTTATGYTNKQKIDYALLANGSVATSLPSGGNYKFEVASDEQSIINGISSDGTITFNNVVGEATVRVAYTWTASGTTYTVYKDIKVSTKEPYVLLEITHDDDKNTNTSNEIVKNTIAIKNVQSGITYNLDAEAYKNGKEKLENVTVTWVSSNTDVATVDGNGVVTFTGEEGTTQITATYIYDGNKTTTDTVKVSASKGAYMVPSDGTADFPEYPNEGAIRFDKTASAVGNFSQTGITQVELSMTGVPYTKGNRMDVVLMLDRSSSMYKSDVQHRISSTVEATKAFVENIVINEDGTFNNNRIMVMDFLGGNLNSSAGGGSSHKYQSNLYTTPEDDGYQVIDSQAELDALLEKIETDFKGQTTLYGTEYAQGLKGCYDALQASKEDGNKQFCVFMSDGIPNYLQGEKNHFESTNDIVAMFDVTNRTADNGTASRNATKYEYEHYSTLMKNDGVTVFTVGLGLKNTNSAWSNTSAAVCEQVANMLLNDISGPARETVSARDTGDAVSKLDKYFFSVADDNAAADMKDVFTGIASEIKEAATDVIVTDKIADEYTMIFDVPAGTKKKDVADALPDNQEFYIEVVSYALDADRERTTETVLRRLYIDNDGVDQDGAYYKNGDTKIYYDAYNADTNPEGVTVSGSGQTLKIDCKYFTYDASTRMLQWKADKLSTTELALRYFLYLDNSATEVGQPIEKEPGTYPTNDYANLTYTNHLGNRCYQEFPVPQMTWNGAQATYVFYLVNAKGQPVNKSGQVVDFANAVFVTAPVTKSMVWNDATDESSRKFDAVWAANEVLPADYTLFDDEASYEVHVFETEAGELAGTNKFIIDGSETLESGKESTTKVYNTKAATKYSVYGTYTSKAVNDYEGETVLEGFDFANTTVAFAVTWTTQLVEDTVVVDYGLPVNIDVLANDIVDASLNSISKTGYTSQALNTGVADKGFADVATITLNNGDTVTHKGNEVYYTQKDMEFDKESVFYYDANVNYYKDSHKLSGYIHSKVTVIPATTVYYEDNFVDFKVYDKVNGQWAENKEATWSTDGTTVDGVQATDRPGTGSLNDANNIYGYDSAYTNMSKHSLGSARYLNVNANRYGTAEFSFYGTGFDVIGLTSNTTGTITIKVTKDVVGENGETTTETVKSLVVDTYYGYTYDETTGEWTVDPEAKNALYQVPVMEVEGLDYGKYNVTIKAAYNSLFDHQTANGNYELYIDAIRIYDPANDGENSTVIENAYKKDEEGWPEYLEIRDNILDAATITSSSTEAELAGVVFIDGISETASFSDYANAGPNNEVYLAAGQAIAFNLGLDDTTVDKVHIGTKSATNVPVSYKIFDASTVESSNDVNAIDAKEMKTSTGMYYDITDLKNSTIVIYNSGDSGILSLTDVKVTHTSKPAEANPSEFYINGKVSQKLIESLNTIKVEEVYEMNVTVPTSVKEGSAAAITVETSKNIEAVTINGVAIEYYSEDASGTRVWNTNVVCETSGTKTVKVVGHNADGNIVAEKEATITVEKKSTTEKVIGALVTWIKNFFGWMSGSN